MPRSSSRTALGQQRHIEQLRVIAERDMRELERLRTIIASQAMTILRQDDEFQTLKRLLR